MTINLKFLQVYTTKTVGWFRVFGYGFGWKNTQVHPLVFSERNNLRWHYEVGKWSFSWLK